MANSDKDNELYEIVKEGLQKLDDENRVICISEIRIPTEVETNNDQPSTSTDDRGHQREVPMEVAKSEAPTDVESASTDNSTETASNELNINEAYDNAENENLAENKTIASPKIINETSEKASKMNKQLRKKQQLQLRKKQKHVDLGGFAVADRIDERTPRESEPKGESAKSSGARTQKGEVHIDPATSQKGEVHIEHGKQEGIDDRIVADSIRHFMRHAMPNFHGKICAGRPIEYKKIRMRMHGKGCSSEKLKRMACLVASAICSGDIACDDHRIESKLMKYRTFHSSNVLDAIDHKDEHDLTLNVNIH